MSVVVVDSVDWRKSLCLPKAALASLRVQIRDARISMIKLFLAP
jgi:hypothetical protein